MERKFVSKLNQLKPAAQARKHASTQLKETIQSVIIDYWLIIIVIINLFH